MTDFKDGDEIVVNGKPFETNHHPQHEDSHALLAAKQEQLTKKAEAALAQALEDNQSLLAALSSEQGKNEQLATVIEEQSSELSQVKRDLQWYTQKHIKSGTLLSEIHQLTREYAGFIDPSTSGQAPSDIITEFERGIAAVGAEFQKHFGRVPF